MQFMIVAGRPQRRLLSFRPGRFSWSCPAARSRRRAARAGFGSASRRTRCGSRREPPINGHADRDCGDAERHHRACEPLKPVELGCDDGERQHEAGSEHQQCGLGIAHALRPWSEAPILQPFRCRAIAGRAGGDDTRQRKRMLEVERPADLALCRQGDRGQRLVHRDQALIDKFADATGDHQWIHVDVERAKREMPGGKTIAHGWLTLSLVPRLASTLYRVKKRSRGLNYGSNRVRFTGQVPAGSRIRLRQRIKSVEPVEGGGAHHLRKHDRGRRRIPAGARRRDHRHVVRLKGWPFTPALSPQAGRGRNMVGAPCPASAGRRRGPRQRESLPRT